MPKMPTTRFPYYVYDLIDPRDDTVFYVGCGTGDRHRVSANDYDGAQSVHKLRCIRSIKKAGLKVRSKIVCSFKTRHEAFKFEWERQVRFSLPNTPAYMPVYAYSGYDFGRRAKRPENADLPTNEIPPPLPKRPEKLSRKAIQSVQEWCGHPDYTRCCRLLPRHCLPPHYRAGGRQV